MDRVVHYKKSRYDVYIGRPSKWGNPFRVGKDGTRDIVIQKYKHWILTQEELLDSLQELEGRVLGCWCRPELCHGDVLVELSDSYKEYKKYLLDILLGGMDELIDIDVMSFSEWYLSRIQGEVIS